MDVIAGDFGENRKAKIVRSGTGKLRTLIVRNPYWFSTKLRGSQVKDVKIVEKPKKVSPGGAAIGGLVGGPVGLVAGALAGVIGKRTTVSISLSDGRTLLCAVDKAELEILRTAARDNSTDLVDVT